MSEKRFFGFVEFGAWVRSQVQTLTDHLNQKLDATATAANSSKLEGSTKAQVIGEARSGLATTAQVAAKLDATANAVSASKLQTARTINGVAFDGTANITVADSTKLPLTGGTLTGPLTGTRGIFTGTGNDFNFGGLEVLGNGTSDTVFPTIGFHQPGLYASSLQLRGGSDFRFYAQGGTSYANVTAAAFIGNGSQLTALNAGNISTGTIPDARLSGTYTGVNITGNAATATKLQTARTIGDVAFDGTANINLPGVNTAGNQNTTGNAATATKLQTARTINGVAFDGTANISIAVGETGRLPLTGGAVTGKTSFTKTDQASWDTAAVEIGAQSGAAYIGFHRHGVYGAIFGLDTGNNFYGNSGLTMSGNITAYSDIRLKTDIEVISDALNKVCNLRGVTYTRIEGNERQTGVIAQEVQAVLPEAVMTMADEQQTLSVAYGNLVGLLVEAIKELKQQVDDLKKEVAMLRGMKP